jgi:hypothetical protein
MGLFLFYGIIRAHQDSRIALMRKLPIPVFSLCLFLLSGFLPAAADLIRQEKFASPSGRYTVVFTELENRKYGKDEMLEDLGNVSHVLYRVDFIAKGDNDPVASTSYADVYGWEAGGRPEKVSAIFRKLIWSPKEDYVIFPEEGWAAQGPSQSKALALNPELAWEKGAVSVGAIEWIDDLSFISDYHFDCDYGILRFDGTTGKTVSMKESESPIGYELVSVKQGKAVIRMLLDNCRMQDIPPRCFTRDLQTGFEEPVPCPTRKTRVKAQY